MRRRIIPMANEERMLKRLRMLYADNAPQCLERLMLLFGRYGLAPVSGEAPRKWSEETSVLISYPDMISEDRRYPLAALASFASTRLAGTFSHIHLLPFFPYSSDDGFSVVDYRTVNETCGTWQDIEALGRTSSLMFDLVLNHASAHSQWFADYVHGVAPHTRYFVEASPDDDLSSVVRPRTTQLLTPVRGPGAPRYVWTTFSDDQVDLDYSNPDVLLEMLDILLFYVSKGASIIRLDAIAFLWKKKGTSCLHLPETHEIVKLLRDLLDIVAPHVVLLTETNVPHDENVSYFGAGDEAHMVYQFALPPLLLHSITAGETTRLAKWLGSLKFPEGCTYLNFASSHDGIGVRPVEDILTADERDALATAVTKRGGFASMRAGADGKPAVYELNISWFAAVAPEAGKDDLNAESHLCTHAVVMAMKGVPAIYFNSLVGAPNNRAEAEKTRQNRAINRKKWKSDELQRHLSPSSPASALFDGMLAMLKARAAEPAFHPDSAQAVIPTASPVLGFIRTPAEGRAVACLHNFGRQPAAVPVQLLEQHGMTRGTLMDLVTGLPVTVTDSRDIELRPCSFLWVTTPAR